MSSKGPAVVFRPLHDWQEYRAAEELQREVWKMPDMRDLVPANLLAAANKNGGLVLGAFSNDGRLIGFAYSFVGLQQHAAGLPQHAAGTPGQGTATKFKHHSHMLAVLPEFRSRGIGVQLKFSQREYVLAQGIDLMTWTYDPLQAQNANLNLTRLGARARAYIVNAYGEMTDGLNAGLASDRFQVEWWLNAPRVRQAAAGAALALDWRALASSGAREVFKVVVDARALPSIEREDELNGDLLLVEIPSDLAAVKSASAELARQWRECTRRVFTRAFARGYAAVGFVFDGEGPGRRAAYVLSNEPLDLGVDSGAGST